MKQISYEEMAEKLWAAKESVARFKFPYRFDFWCNYDAETDEKEWAYHAEVSMFADAPVVIINYYGGGAGFIYDIAEDGDPSGLAGCLQNYFIHQGLEESVWVEDKNAIFLYSGVELGSVARCDKKPVGASMRWWVRSADVARGRERVVIIVEGGAVTETYATNHSISVDVIDKDVQTPEDERELENELEDLKRDIEEDILHAV